MDTKTISKNRYQIVKSTVINYAELMLDIVNQTDRENWDYFCEENSQVAREFLDYGSFSRVITIQENGVKTAVAYIQLRILKQQAPQLLYKDLYHLAGLDGIDLWEKTKYSSHDLPIYIDVIAIKQAYQNRLELLKLVPEALQEILFDIGASIQETPVGDIYAVGVTDKGRKMCQMLGMSKLSEVERIEEDILHTRTLYKSERVTFGKKLDRLISKIKRNLFILDNKF